MNKWLQKQDAPQWRIYGFFVIGILALISIVLLIQNDIGKKNKADNTPDQPDNLIVPNIVRAEPNEVAEGFPKELVLNSKIEITESYSATYPNSPAKQVTVEFTSSKSADKNFDFYKNWAETNGWQIINADRTKPPVYSLYLKKPGEQVNITINKGTITISYVELNK